MSENATMQDGTPVGLPEAPEKVQQNYWGFQETFDYVFPDGITFIKFRVMNEGDKVKFQKSTSRDILLNRVGEARMKMDTGSERHAIITTCAMDWNFLQGDQRVPFNERVLKQWLEVADPKLVEKIEVEVRKHNPWLLGELSSKDIKEQITELEEMLKIAEEREAGEASSSSR